ncbi:conserved hypothetical protein [Desulfonatronospira thiodismutans ASO3-1]|uniref:Lipoprotein n=1 Tax=Desulfonatronospira thiodismutans ASO3-1 TaxID=555779 RepID=D6SS15_9BACT|nr:hypothetical protein [Desulfonatronospira thiodismutans]EFI33481.1 conserved hypothetical protein [Desulfonatronospira thiodismutans ASO3-1]
MKTLIRMVSIVILSTVLLGCAFGNKHSYHDAIANINIENTIAVAVTAHDQRAYIVSGNKDPDFVGLQRGGYGNPFDVKTESGNSLADDMSKSLANSLVERGFEVQYISVSSNMDKDSVIDKLKEKGSDRLLVMTINEWKSDTYNNTALIYDMKVSILDGAGMQLASNSIKGRDNLGGSFINPAGHAKQVIPKAFTDKIELLINDKEIRNVLQY